jgi:hypothetical protein
MKSIVASSGLFTLMLVLCAGPTFAADADERLNQLEESVKKQELTIEQQQETINNLKTDIEKQKAQTAPQEPASTPQAPKASGLFGGSVFTNPSISLILDTFYYRSNLTNEELSNWNIPGFTTQGLDQRNGFNLDSVELFFFSPVDPYFNMYVDIPVTDNGVSIEEAYVVTTDMPQGWQIKGGRFKSNFSRLDAQHPHAWDFWDIALPYRAFLGKEGLGGENGVQLTYLPVLPVYTQLGAEVLQGENDLLFGPDAAQGPHAFTFFVKSSVDTSDYSTIYFGPYVLFGKTENQNIVPGAVVEADSSLYGMEAVWKWKPSNREALTIQSEYLFLLQSGTSTGLTNGIGESLRRKQDGFYVQGIYRKNRWGVGARYDLLELFQDTFKLGGLQQNFGGKPHRETASLEYNPSEFTRVRFQLSRDCSDTTSGQTNDEAILQFIFSIGAHPAHSF